MALSQSLQQKLLQKLSPQQIQLMKLLQVPTANLEERIKEELEENPALEQVDEDDGSHDEEPGEFDDLSDDDYDSEDSADEFDNMDFSEYIGEDDSADYKTRDENYPDSDENKVIPYRVEKSFHDLLVEQLGMLTLDDKQKKIAEQITGSIDDDGYLRREAIAIVDDLAFRQNIITTEAEVEEVIKMIQQFDPPGVAARNLQECLLIQLDKLRRSGKDVDLAIQVIDLFFEEFTKKHY